MRLFLNAVASFHLGDLPLGFSLNDEGKGTVAGATLRGVRGCTGTLNLPAHIRRPVVNLREGPAHQRGTLCLRELVRDPERLNALLVGQ